MKFDRTERKKELVTVNVHALNVRSTRSKEADNVIQVVKQYDILEAINWEKGSKWVRVITPSGIEGFVMAEYII